MEISDQQIESFIRQVPLLLWGFHKNLQEKGFSEEEAFTLTRDYLVATIHNQHE
jgi:hypothetical protein